MRTKLRLIESPAKRPTSNMPSDERATARLRGEVFGLVYRQMHALAGRASDFDDLVQIAAEQVFRSLSSFQERSAPATWTYRICYHTLLKQRRWYRRWIKRFVVTNNESLPENFEHTAVPGTDQRLTSGSVNSSVDISYYPRPERTEPVWANYPRGVLAEFLDRGLVPPSIDACLVSNVPLGAGLSSSAALEVAVAKLLEAACDTAIDRYDLARLCRKAEHEFALVPCGIMDQLVSVLGDRSGALLIDCQSEVARVIQMSNPHLSILVANTNVRHSLASGEYASRHAQCRRAAQKLGVASLREASLSLLQENGSVLNAIEFKRATHVITEDERTLRAVEALTAGDGHTLGRLMYESHASLRNEFEVSCRELDILVEAAQSLGEESGVLGARMTGGGFGGCTVTLLENEFVDEVLDSLSECYLKATQRNLTAFVTRPARGAHLVNEVSS